MITSNISMHLRWTKRTQDRQLSDLLCQMSAKVVRLVLTDLRFWATIPSLQCSTQSWDQFGRKIPCMLSICSRSMVCVTLLARPLYKRRTTIYLQLRKKDPHQKPARILLSVPLQHLKVEQTRLQLLLTLGKIAKAHYLIPTSRTKFPPWGLCKLRILITCRNNLRKSWWIPTWQE